MTTTKTGREIALERRQALSSLGKATVKSTVATPDVTETMRDSDSNAVSQPLSARERRQRMSKTGQADLPSVERTRAMVMKDAPKPVVREMSASTSTTYRPESGAQPPKSEAQRRREQLSKYGKAGLSQAQSPSMASRTRAQALRSQQSQVGKGAVEAVEDAPTASAVNHEIDPRDVSGTPLAQHPEMTGADRGLCREVTGTEYFSSEVFQTLCPRPEAAASTTVNADRVTGRVATTQLLRPSSRYADDVTADGLTVTGGETARSRVTGTEGDRSPRMTGSQYRNVQLGTAVRQRGRDQLMDSGRLTGHFLDGHRVLTGATEDRGSDVTGDNYADNRRTSRAQRSSAPRAGGSRRAIASPRISGITEESSHTTGTPDAVLDHMSGTPYSGSEASPRGMSGHAVTGTQPAIGAGVTGDGRGGDGAISGTPYLGEDHLAQTFGYESVERPQRQFSVMTERHASTPYQQVTSGITGSFGKGDGKVTGANDAAFGSYSGPSEHTDTPIQVTGEGATSGKKITGDDWDRNPSVTGTEGPSSHKRNTTRRGGQTMHETRVSRPERSTRDVPTSKVTGSSGNTSDGALITYSGGARG